MSSDFPQLLLSAATLASVYALVALGLNLIYGTMRLLNVAHGEIMTLGGYFVFVCFSALHLPPWLSIPVAMALAAVLGVLCYQGLFSWQMRSPQLAKRLESNSLLVFFGLSTVLQNVIALAFTSDPRSYTWLDRVLEFGSVSFLENRLVLLVVGVAATLALLAFFRFSMIGLAVRALIQQRDAAALGSSGRLLVGTPDASQMFYPLLALAVAATAINVWLSRSRFGHGLRAISEDETAAATLGVPTLRYKLLAFALSAVIPGMVGVFAALRSTYFEPMQLFNPLTSFTIVSMAIIGGSQRPSGPVLGACFITLLSELLWAEAPQLYMIIIGLLLVGFVLLAPGGLAGFVQKWRGRRS